jgi:hypothetical protein
MEVGELVEHVCEGGIGAALHPYDQGKQADHQARNRAEFRRLFHDQILPEISGVRG